jgi:F0F1-type ATP synthase delta subunit
MYEQTSSKLLHTVTDGVSPVTGIQTRLVEKLNKKFGTKSSFHCIIDQDACTAKYK